jgi:sodium transport system permease protein
MAAFARSTKEGQYYLMPLMAVTIPLAILPAAAGLELNLGTSLIPVAGLVLLLRAALEGNYWQALQFLVPVLAITLAGCLLAIRWAVEQFNSESVLFRESERLDLRLWLHHLVEDRGPTPTAAEAVFCGVVILVVHFFLSLKSSPKVDFPGFAVQVAVIQLAVVLTPALVMAVMLTSSLRQTLLLRWPRWSLLPAAALLAVVLHPAVNVLQVGVIKLYPLSEEMQKALTALESVFMQPPWWQVVLVVAAAPAVCEELAFRGFIFTGLCKTDSPWRAIFVSAAFFGLTHGILQQSMIACLIGVLLGWLAFQTRSILPGMVFHLVHNAMGVLTARVPRSLAAEWPMLGYLFHPSDQGGTAFPWPVVLAGSLAAVLIMIWLARHAEARPGNAGRGLPLAEGLPIDV